MQSLRTPSPTVKERETLEATISGMRIDADCAVKRWAEFGYFLNLVPRASFPVTSSRKTRALGATISGMRFRCRLRIEQDNQNKSE